MTDNAQVPIQYYLEVAWRRKWWVVIPFLISVAISAGLLYKLPKAYLSSTLILVEPQQVPEDYVKSAISGTIEDRLSTIQQQIQSRTLLQKIVDELGLYQKESKRMSQEDVINLFRSKINIGTVGNKKGVDAFTISYEGENPAVAMNVTNKLASLFIEENLKIREQLVEGTSNFLENELKSIKSSLDQQEEKISEYKKQYMGELPEQLDANLRTLDRYQMELQSITAALKIAEDRKTNLEQMLSEAVKSQEGASLSPSDSGEPADPDYAKLARMKQELQQLQAEYKDSYPDVIALKKQISELEGSLSKRPVRDAEINKKESATREPSRESAMTSQETAFYRDSQRQLQEVSIEARSLRARYKEVLQQIQLYEKRVEDTPKREQQLMTLERDYESTKKNYQSLLDKKLNAQISENLEKRQKGEQFRILDPANLPERPFKPDPRRLFGLGLASGLGVGIGLVLLVEMLDTSFKRPEEIEEVLGLPVLASIPRFERKKIKAKLMVAPEASDVGGRLIKR